MGVKPAISLGFRATELTSYTATYTEPENSLRWGSVRSHYGIDEVPPQCDWKSNDSWR